MQEPSRFCAAVMHEYERRWAGGGSHAVRHPLRLKMERLRDWCDGACSPEEFERQLEQARRSDDPGEALLADELLPLWRAAGSGALPFAAS